MVHSIQGRAEFNSIISTKKVTVVEFTAVTWCGPCRMVAPLFDALAPRFPEVGFYKVEEEKEKELIHGEGIRAFPTFRFYYNGQMLDEVRGGDMNSVEANVNKYMAQYPSNPFQGTGHTLGGDSSNSFLTIDPREARLARFNIQSSSPPIVQPPENAKDAFSPEKNTMTESDEIMQLDQEDQEDEKLLQEALEREKLQSENNNMIEELREGIDPVLLDQLKDMGFDEAMSRKALNNTMSISGLASENTESSSHLEQAIQWIDLHQHDWQNFGNTSTSSTGEGGKKKLTADELKERIAKRRQQRTLLEKQQDIEREKKRREDGKLAQQQNEEIEKSIRKRELEKKKKEQKDAAKHRKEILARLEQDKMERMAKAGKKVVNPPNSTNVPPTTTSSSTSISSTKPTTVAPEGTGVFNEQEIMKAIQSLKQQKTRDVGLNALKLLQKYIGNIVKNPAEEKYRSINAENETFKTKVGHVVGGRALLKGIGFTRTIENKWTLSMDIDYDNLKIALNRIEYAVVNFYL